MRLKKHLLLSTLALGGVSLISAGCQSTNDDSTAENQNALKDVKALLDKYEEDPVLADIYKDSYQDYAALKQSAEKGENIVDQARKLQNQMEARKTIALIASGVLRPSDADVQKNLDKIFDTLGIEPVAGPRANVGSDGETRTSSSLSDEIKSLKDLIDQLKSEDTENLTLISNVNAQLAALQRLVDRATSSLLKRRYSPKEAALIAGSQLINYINQILHTYPRENRYYNSILQRYGRDTNLLQDIKNTEVTSETYLSLQQNVNDFVTSFAVYFRFFSSGREDIGPKVEPLATQPEQFMNELAAWRISLIERTINYFNSANNLTFRNDVTKENYIEALNALKAKLENVAKAETFIDQAVIYADALEYFDLTEAPKAEAEAKAYITRNRAGDIVALYAKAGEPGASSVGDIQTLSGIKYLPNPLDNVIVDSAFANIKTKAENVNAQITAAKADEKYATVFDSVFYEKQRKIFDEFAVDPEAIKYLDIQTKAEFYAYLEDAKLSLENIINSLNSSQSNDLAIIKARIEALYSETNGQSGTGVLATNYRNLVENKLSTNANLQDVKTFYDAELTKLKALEEDTVAKAYDKYVAFVRLNAQIVGLAKSYNFFYDAGFTNVDDEQLQAILNYPKGDELPADQKARVERRINNYQRNYDDYKAKYEFWVEHKASIAIDVFAEGSSRYEAISASDDLEANKELARKYIGGLKESLPYVKAALAEGGLYAPSVEYVEATQNGLKEYETIYNKYKEKYEKLDTLSAEEVKALVSEYIEEMRGKWSSMEMEYEYVEKIQVDEEKAKLDAEKAKLSAGNSDFKKVPGQEIYMLLRKAYFELGDQMKNNALPQYYNADNSNNQRRDGVAYDNSQGLLNSLNSSDDFNSIARIFVPAVSPNFQGTERQPYVDVYNQMVTLENAYLEAHKAAVEANEENKEAAKTQLLEAMRNYYNFLNDAENSSLFNGLETVGNARPRVKFDLFMYRSEKRDEDTNRVIDRGFKPFDLANFYGQLLGSVDALTKIKDTQKA